MGPFSKASQLNPSGIQIHTMALIMISKMYTIASRSATHMIITFESQTFIIHPSLSEQLSVEI